MEIGVASYNRFLQGDKKAFEQIVSLYGEPLVRFARSFLPSYADAEDVMMDVFAALIVKPRTFRNESALKTYLYRAVRNRAIDRWRKERRVVPLAYAENAAYCLPDGAGEDLSQALLSLPEQYREVLQLVYGMGFSVEETGTILNKDKKQVYNLLCRARSSLKKTFEEDTV